jgi:hypothetical protein
MERVGSVGRHIRGSPLGIVAEGLVGVGGLFGSADVD